MSFKRHLKHPLIALAGALCAVLLVLATGAGGVIGGVATACAQSPPPLPIPTLGPLDPSCGQAPDSDNDGVFDDQDNCVGYYNPSQEDTDQDSGEPPYAPYASQRDPKTGGDTCDIDDDNDGVSDVDDNCPKVANPDQADDDADGKGNKCDPQNDLTGAPSGPAAPVQAQASAQTAPKLTIEGLARRQHLAELRAGLAVPVRCTAPCAVAGDLRLKPGRVVLGRGAAKTERAGLTFVFVRLTRAGRSRVARVRRAPATLRLIFSAADGSGRSVVRKSLVLGR
jgi:hypothetical protein